MALRHDEAHQMAQWYYTEDIVGTPGNWRLRGRLDGPDTSTHIREISIDLDAQTYDKAKEEAAQYVSRLRAVFDLTTTCAAMSHTILWRDES